MNAYEHNEELNSQDKAYIYLKNAIINLELRPNQKLTAQEVAFKLAISRTPVREAFSKLAQEGLVLRQGGWGYVVSPLTFKDAMNIFRMRETLEVEAVKEVIPKLNNDSLKFINSYLIQAEDRLRAGDVDAYRVSTRGFYRAIAETTDNNILEFMLSIIDDRVRWVGAMITNKHDNRPKESLLENKNIFQALESRNEGHAVAAIRKHITGARESFLKYVTEESSSFRRD